MTVKNEPRLPSTLPKRTEQTCVCPAACWLNDHLRQTFRGAEYRFRVRGLIGGDKHEARCVHLEGCLDQVLRPLHVGFDALTRVPFQQGQVLVRRGVNDDVRTRGLEDLPDPSSVADVRDDHIGTVEERLAVEFELKGVQVRFVVIEHVQRSRIAAPDLAAQLLADRTAGTGDENPSTGEGTAGCRPQVAALLAAKQVVEIDDAHVHSPGRPL